MECYELNDSTRCFPVYLNFIQTTLFLQTLERFQIFKVLLTTVSFFTDRNKCIKFKLTQTNEIDPQKHSELCIYTPRRLHYFNRISPIICRSVCYW